MIYLDILSVPNLRCGLNGTSLEQCYIDYFEL